MTEDQIERVVERSTNKADRRLMAGIMSQADYDAEMAELSAWADRKYAERLTDKASI